MTTIQDFLGRLRAHWLVICTTAAVAVAGAATVTMLTTPLYEASSRLLVSTTTGGESQVDAYQGTLFIEQRVTLYTKLLTGEALAQRTIDKLHLDMSAATLQANVEAIPIPDTGLIRVSVRDPSSVRARDIVDALSDEFVVMAGELANQAKGAKRDDRVVVEQHASMPTSPAVPNTTRNLASGLSVGVLLGIYLALARDRLDDTVKDQQTLEEVTGVEVVANIPTDKGRRRNPAISFADDCSSIAESFRQLRTNIQFLEVDDPPRIILIASSLPGEGKSITALNIASALAAAEHDVLLVDGDMRQPKLDTYLGLNAPLGFSTVLTGESSLHEALQNSRYPRLTVLTSGPIPPNPSELFSSMATKKVLNEVRSNFEYVIVDSPALLPVTDTAVLAAEADGVLVIARFGKTKREQVSNAVESLRKVEARILGAILTMTPARGGPSRGLHRSAPSSEVPAQGNSAARARRRNSPRHAGH